MTIVHSTDLIQKRLIESQPGEGVIYGAGVFKPGHAYGELVAAFRGGTFLGVAGLMFGESDLPLPGELRASLGHVLREVSGDNLFVYDDLSVQWAAHWGIVCRLGGNPSWLASADFARKVLEEELVIWSPSVSSVPSRSSISNGIVVAVDVGAAVAAALCGMPCVYIISHPWGELARETNHPLSRFANRIGRTDLLRGGSNKWELHEDAESEAMRVKIVSPSVVERERELAMETMGLLLGKERPTTADGVLRGVFGASEVEVKTMSNVTSSRPRVINVGDVFDPATHYVAEYYGEGAGLLYPAADGTRQLYKGPAMDWDGYEKVLDNIEAVFPKGSLLDIGCGGGGFVRRARARGWDAFGVDISEAAISRAREFGDWYFLADLLKGHGDIKQKFTLITALDFWEHIWSGMVNPLMASMKDLLVENGSMFNIICTRTATESDWTINPGDMFTTKNGWLLVSGHVTIRRWAWWAKAFRANGMRLRNEIAYLFQVSRDEDPALALVDSWKSKNLVVVTG